MPAAAYETDLLSSTDMAVAETLGLSLNHAHGAQGMPHQVLAKTPRNPGTQQPEL